MLSCWPPVGGRTCGGALGVLVGTAAVAAGVLATISTVTVD